ncbi:MAG: hypothetical protein DRO18_04505 [Thermoprotei archaeon]|nr:MAG: hypothetical protein DRO18_04505 [Thermoprotei archaeon]
MSKYGDVRSGKIALVAHCILNQNSIVPGLARRQAMVKEVVDVLERYGIGIIQLPCPETLHSGLRRFWQVKEQYSSTGFKRLCRRLSRMIVDYVREYLRNDYRLVLILGVAGSPSCGIRETNSSPKWFGDPRKAGNYVKIRESGVFMEELINSLRNAKLLSNDTILTDIDYSNISASVRELEGRLRDVLDKRHE